MLFSCPWRSIVSRLDLIARERREGRRLRRLFGPIDRMVDQRRLLQRFGA